MAAKRPYGCSLEETVVGGLGSRSTPLSLSPLSGACPVLTVGQDQSPVLGSARSCFVLSYPPPPRALAALSHTGPSGDLGLN